MPAVPFIGRVLEYGRRHGLRATLRRANLSVRRSLAGNRLVLFYTDITAELSGPLIAAEHTTIERIAEESEIEPEDLRQILEVWNPGTARHLITERFAKGSSLWLCKRDGRLAGYGWSIIGRTVEPHFFPLGEKDAHLFDFYVFPEHRGLRLNPFLVGQILATLGREGCPRAFIEAAEWNAPQLSSLGRMPFRRLGLARKFSFLGRTFVIWSGRKNQVEKSN